MNREEFIQAKLFMFSDVEREIQLARAGARQLQAMGITPGGGNFLAALALLCYTEFGGKLQFGVKRPSANFNKFFDALGRDYAAFRATCNVYDVFRCGLAHEYYAKKNCTIAMLSTGPGPGIGTESTGHHFFIVENYCRDLKTAFDNLQTSLFGR